MVLFMPDSFPDARARASPASDTLSKMDSLPSLERMGQLPTEWFWNRSTNFHDRAPSETVGKGFEQCSKCGSGRGEEGRMGPNPVTQPTGIKDHLCDRHFG